MSKARSDDRHRMVERQIAARGIDDEEILAAFREVPREAFVDEGMAEFAYEDTALPIAAGQTISQPYIVACMIDAAGVGSGDRVLEVGAGSGYAAAVLSRIGSKVYAIERHDVLAREAADRIAKLGYDNCRLVTGDGTNGLADFAPYDAILVAARREDIPDALKRQLKVGGRLVIPVGADDVQQLRVIERTGEASWEAHDIMPVRFVPLLNGIEPEDGSRAASNHRGRHPNSLAEAIAAACQSLPEIDDPEFAVAFDRFADRRVVMLGECSHGTHEFYAARAAITRRLVERHGYTIVAVEGDWPDAAIYNQHIQGTPAKDGGTAPFQRFPTWMWRNTVMPRFLATLRGINAERDADSRVGFYGLDIYNMSGSIEAVLAYLDETDPEAAQMARARYGCLSPWQSDPATYGRAALRKGYAECEDAVVEQCRELLDRALDSDGESFSAAMNARLVASAERYYRVMYYGGAESWNLRDSHMTDTLEHLLEQGGAGSKAIVWAHNSHIGDARATDMGAVRGEHNIGQLARERWGEENVALVGFGTHTGTVSAATDWDGEREIKRVNPSRHDSYERLCHDSRVDRFLLDLRKDGMVTRRLLEPCLERFIGVIYRPETERWSHYSEVVLPRQFDAYVWFDETSALQPLDPHETHSGVPDTFPYGE
ncbi:protein-L-isoaspartate(D-aspartate) O-methyltransferase [Alteriqipengyuania flavescens]|uniref:protein-L-isoaspartate(D-aspartate) O-methyltransferase n=1 Tax=Alteriqipengyuania flavescens TaxID=3053610 RepID=UPI0025B2DC35|nr:protein-L-isoaspartate(D-aspartate) O-methyltransferase [Alteriqipengyuania flavescens]WJY19887.1 protein-L-isoaspartate(D-aspartate) O-methyltransferase [Alteriqipengyuania flavescens]WJY25829.1 protein-L-isoaspartate(D-aspartate) O-methyltransferase [Alteriqipengyuania flavescens]